jgi:hypothetical protein
MQILGSILRDLVRDGTQPLMHMWLKNGGRFRQPRDRFACFGRRRPRLGRRGRGSVRPCLFFVFCSGQRAHDGYAIRFSRVLCALGAGLIKT